LKMFEAVWLKDRKYVASTDDLSIADLVACCELMQLKLINFDFTPYPKVTEWMERVMAKKEMQKVHEKFDRVKKAMDANRAEAKPKL